DLVDLVEDHPLDAGEVFAELGGAQDDCDALRCRDEDMRRTSELPLPLLGGRVPGTHAHADLRLRLPLLLRQGGEILMRFLGDMIVWLAWGTIHCRYWAYMAPD